MEIKINDHSRLRRLFDGSQQFAVSLIGAQSADRPPVAAAALKLAQAHCPQIVPLGAVVRGRGIADAVARHWSRIRTSALDMVGADEHFPWNYTEFGVLCACGEPMSAREVCPRDFGDDLTNHRLLRAVALSVITPIHSAVVELEWQLTRLGTWIRDDQ
ncbi:MAG: hypothetical protein PGN37_20495 [Mycobacterium kyogaense]|uniref:hypothetical protein n=1 Tax=Mycobacterium kyogaense TaxID=2212479 RepID=UPI002FF5A00C